MGCPDNRNPTISGVHIRAAECCKLPGGIENMAYTYMVRSIKNMIYRHEALRPGPTDSGGCWGDWGLLFGCVVVWGSSPEGAPTYPHDEQRAWRLDLCAPEGEQVTAQKSCVSFARAPVTSPAS